MILYKVKKKHGKFNVANALLKAIAENLKEGYSLQTDYFLLIPGVSGVFIDENDCFDPTRHEVELPDSLKKSMYERTHPCVQCQRVAHRIHTLSIGGGIILYITITKNLWATAQRFFYAF